VHVVRQQSSEDADFAGTGNVDQIGLESLKHFSDEWDVAKECRVDAQIFFEGEGQKAAWQLKRPHVPILNQALGAVSGTDAQEGEIVPAGKSLKMPAGVGDTVHLME
jgi:hypothetical protein